MHGVVSSASSHFKGVFVTEPLQILQRLRRIKAFVFDWDGVFNNGEKNDNGTSSFNEVDSMGTNLLRFDHFLHHGSLPIVAVISGENNKAAATLARRESFNAVYSGIKFKTEALQHLCEVHGIKPEEIAFVFDDVLDFSIAEKAGIRIMVQRSCNPLLTQYAVKHKLVDYLTENAGGKGALREATEFIMSFGGKFDESIKHRMNFSDTYQQYLTERNQSTPLFYTSKDSQIIEHSL
ncbi:MAG: phosphatase [Sphingobacteriales bacterium]|nr:MAG: phosphatase [Sphingobacteriales bacterium]